MKATDFAISLLFSACTPAELLVSFISMSFSTGSTVCRLVQILILAFHQEFIFTEGRFERQQEAFALRVKCDCACCAEHCTAEKKHPSGFVNRGTISIGTSVKLGRVENQIFTTDGAWDTFKLVQIGGPEMSVIVPPVTFMPKKTRKDVPLYSEPSNKTIATLDGTKCIVQFFSK